MEIAISQTQARVPVTILQVQGKIDSTNYQEFGAAAQQVMEAGAEYLLIDLSYCGYISSAGIRSLNEIFLKFRKSHPDESREKDSRSQHVKLLKPSEKISDVLAISGVDAFFEIHTDLAAALASF